MGPMIRATDTVISAYLGIILIILLVLLLMHRI